MSQVAQKTRKTTSSPTPKNDIGDHRLLILPTGQFGFLGKQACKALGITQKSAKGGSARELLCFTSEDDAVVSSPFNVKEGIDVWVQSIRSGTHTLLNKKGEEVSFQFDQLSSGDKIFVVASLIEKGIVSDGASLEEWIEQTLVPDKPKSTSSKKIDVVQDNTTPMISAAINDDMFLDLSNDIMISCAVDGQFQSVNAQFTQTLGYVQEQIEKLSFIDVVHPEDRAEVRPILRNSTDEELELEDAVQFETRCVSRLGKTYPIAWKLKVQGDSIYMVGQDLSARKYHEQSLTDHEALLSEAQAIGHMGHWTWHMDNHKIEWSDEIYRIFGLDQESFTPSIETLTSYLNRRDVGRTMQAFQRAMIEKRDYEMEFSIKRPTGEVRYIKCQGRCKLDEDREVTHLFGIMQDVTPQIEHEQELKAAKESVERAYAAKSQFLANMSHELRTPLNAIIGFSEMMQRQLLGPIGTEKYLDYINGIRESGEHLLDLITDILDMSKIEAGKYELITEQVNIGKVIQVSVHMMEGRALDGGLKLTTKLEKDDVVITADRRAVTQVLLNLLSNAVKFTKEKGEISVTCKRLKNTVQIIVKDNGIGIPAMKLNAITNPFEQVSCQYSRDHEGSGLGLAITKELVELHGGELKIDSKVNVGTTVTVTLPA